jgi:hypothetical protein
MASPPGSAFDMANFIVRITRSHSGIELWQTV